jgi:hypothetical protein
MHKVYGGKGLTFNDRNSSKYEYDIFGKMEASLSAESVTVKLT